MAEKPKPEFVYRLLSHRFDHHLEKEINLYARHGWEPTHISGDPGPKEGRSDLGVYCCLLRKKFDLLSDYEKDGALRGMSIYVCEYSDA